MQGKKKKDKDKFDRKPTFMVLSASEKEIKFKEETVEFRFDQQPEYRGNLEKGMNELFAASGKMYDLLEGYLKYISLQNRQAAEQFQAILKSIREISSKMGLVTYSRLADQGIAKLKKQEYQSLQKIIIHMLHQANNIQEMGYQFLAKPVSPKDYFSFEVKDVKGVQDMKEVYPEEARLNLTAKSP